MDYYQLLNASEPGCGVARINLIYKDICLKNYNNWTLFSMLFVQYILHIFPLQTKLMYFELNMMNNIL